MEFVTYHYLLLLTTLDIITYTLRLIQKNHPGVKIDIENLPIEKKVIEAIYATGDTKAIFQFESPGMVKFLKQLQPSCIEDIIAANAMYRPGPMDEIPNYIKAKQSGEIHYDCPQLEPILGSTYGIIVYQEQVMRIVRDLAGYSMGRSDLVRRAMSKKKLDVLTAERKNFVYGNPDENIRGCIANGISKEAANTIFDKMTSFASYAFNKSHAAAYSVTSYMTAWLKYYYPVEFFTAALNYTDKIEDLPSLISDVKNHGIEMLPPNINRSDVMFTTELHNGKMAIRFGLSFLRGCKKKAIDMVIAREGGFKDMRAFVEAEPGKTMAEACILTGALGEQRAMRMAFFNTLDTLYTKMKRAKEKYDTLLNTEGAPQQKIDDAKKALELAQEAYTTATTTKVPEYDNLECMQLEAKYAGVWFKGNPMSEYAVEQANFKKLAELQDGDSAWVAGVITEIEKKKTKSTSQTFMTGLLNDDSAALPFVIYAGVLDRMTKNNTKVELVMKMKVRMVCKDGESGKLVVDQIESLPRILPTELMLKNPNDAKRVVEAAKYDRSTAPRYQVVYRVNNELKPLLPVSKEALERKNIQYTIIDSNI